MAVSLLGVRRVCAIGAHPDDIELGCLGTLLKLGASVEITAFLGCLGSSGDPTTGMGRVQESRAAFECLRLHDFQYRNKSGIGYADFEPLLAHMTEVLDRANPDLILCQGPKDTHQEHRLVWEVCQAAARRTRASILHYAVVSNTPDFSPNVFVDITDFYAAKKRALARFESQVGKEYFAQAHLDIFNAHTYASLRGIRHAEAFELVRAFL